MRTASVTVHHATDGEKTRFEKAENFQATMRGTRRGAQGTLLGERREEGRIIDEAACKRMAFLCADVGMLQIIEERGERLAG